MPENCKNCDRSPQWLFLLTAAAAGVAFAAWWSNRHGDQGEMTNPSDLLASCDSAASQLENRISDALTRLTG